VEYNSISSSYSTGMPSVIVHLGVPGGGGQSYSNGYATGIPNAGIGADYTLQTGGAGGTNGSAGTVSGSIKMYVVK
jgi:hypothetical protein